MLSKKVSTLQYKLSKDRYEKSGWYLGSMHPNEYTVTLYKKPASYIIKVLSLARVYIYLALERIKKYANR